MFRRSGETLPAFELNLFKNVLATALMVPTILLVDGISWPGYSSLEWLVVIVSGVVGIAVADTWYLRALNLMGASRTGVVASLYSPFVIIMSILFLGEALIWWQYFGFVLVLAGILLVTWRQNRRDVSLRAIRLGVAFGAGAVLMMATGIVLVKPILETESFMWTMGVRLAAGTVGMLLFLHATRGTARAMLHYRSSQPWMIIVIGSLLGSYLSMMLWLAGYKLTQASVASVLNETAAAFIVIFAWLFLGEDMNWRRLAGIAMTFSGVGLMVAF